MTWINLKNDFSHKIQMCEFLRNLKSAANLINPI